MPSTKGSEKIKKTPQLLRGMKDIMPEDQQWWDFIRMRVDNVARAYGFGRLDTPLLEDAALFTRSVGKETDIVEKEMYTFEDKNGSLVSLRPEGTAGVVRAYIEHGMLNRPQPVKMYYLGQFFRYDRPQAGRYRQFYQFGFEVVGEQNPVIDAQVMMLAFNFYAEINLPVTLQVNSVGCGECHDEYRKVLVDYYRSRKNSLCEDCKRRLQKNPLRLLDCKQEDCQVLAQDAPQTVDHLCEECNEHFVKVLEHLDELEIPYVLNSRLVRGLDYYTRTVFEIWPEPYDPPKIEEPEETDDKKDRHKKSGNKKEEEIEISVEPTPIEEPKNKMPSQNALGGGGRYDDLVETMGGQPTPAIGFSGGIERLITELRLRNLPIGDIEKPEVFVAQLGDSARKKALKLFEDLRQAGFKVAESFSKDGLKPQMELADKIGVKFAVIIGQKEIMDGTILIRDMESGIQETVDFKKVIPEVQKRLEKYGVKAKVIDPRKTVI